MLNVNARMRDYVIDDGDNTACVSYDTMMSVMGIISTVTL